MTPSLRSGSLVLFTSLKNPREGDIVVAMLAGVEVVKRVASIKNDKLYLTGDNAQSSVDSREYGPVNRGAISGVVIWSR